jgi:isoleucyl-tRNA synthetase
MNTAIALAQRPILMAEAMRDAVIAGRKAFLAGRIPRKLHASASFVFYEGPPTAERPAAQRPRAHARHEGSVPALHDDARLPRGAPRGLGHPRPARSRSRSRKSCASAVARRSSRLRRRGLRPPLPRVVFRYTSEWEHLTEKIGFWVDLEKAYVTYHKSYVESVWWALSELFKKGLLYKGHKVVWWWAQGGTALSSGEVGLGLQDGRRSRRCTSRFPLVERTRRHGPGGVDDHALDAVEQHVRRGARRSGLRGRAGARERRKCSSSPRPSSTRSPRSWGRELRVQKRMYKGAELIGAATCRPSTRTASPRGPTIRYFRVVAGESSGGPPQWFVTLEAGTGVVHIAPAFGEDDWKVWRNQSKPTARSSSCSAPCEARRHLRRDVMGELAGTWVKDADKAIMRAAQGRGLLVHSESTATSTRSAGAPTTTRSSSTRATPGSSAPPRSTRSSTTTRPGHLVPEHIQATAASATSWPTTSTGRCRVSASGARRSTSGPARPAAHGGAVLGEAAIESRNPARSLHFTAAKAADPSLSEHLMVHKPWIDACHHAVQQVQRRHHEARARGDRLLVRLGLHAVRAVRLPARGGLKPPSSARSRPTSSPRLSIRRAAGSTR